jgi:Protein of unknown function (DUF3616)
MKANSDKGCQMRHIWSKLRHEVAMIAVLVLSGPVVSSIQAQTKLSAPLRYSGVMDGSAAVALDSTFFANASDEDSVIRIYHRETGGMPAWEIDLSSFLQVTPRSSETDIEAATSIGNRAYWITSHGRNKNGKERPGRQRFFATDISTNEHGLQLSPVGKPCTNLLTDLVAAEQLKQFDLVTAAARRPKSPGGLSIEGLAATLDKHLLIAFRNPVPQERALIVPLLNPDEVIQGEHALFGTAIQLNLGGLGIRDMASWQGEFIIIAGPPGDGGPFKLFRWNGGDSTPEPIRRVSLKNLHPEAVIIYPDKGVREFQLLSDDSAEQDDIARNVSATHATKHFRSVWIKP